MKIEDLTILPAWKDCFIAKKNKNGTMSVQRKALTNQEMLEVVAFYGGNRLETGFKQDILLQDGTKVVIVHTEHDKEIKAEKNIWHPIGEKADGGRFVVFYDTDGDYMSPPSRCLLGFDSDFVKAMNKKYGANYDMWAYKDDLAPKKQKEEYCDEKDNV